MGPDPDETFATREEAERERDRLNREPPEYGYSWWSVASPAEGAEGWRVVRTRGVMVEDIATDAAAYEEALRAAVEAMASDRDYWREVDGIEIESVAVGGSYPGTMLAVLFRPVRTETFGERQFDCHFGYRVRIWPAEYRDPEEEAYFWRVYFQEFLGTSLRARPIWHGPCSPEKINWLA